MIELSIFIDQIEVESSILVLALNEEGVLIFIGTCKVDEGLHFIKLIWFALIWRYFNFRAKGGFVFRIEFN